MLAEYKVLKVDEILTVITHNKGAISERQDRLYKIQEELDGLIMFMGDRIGEMQSAINKIECAVDTLK